MSDETSQPRDAGMTKRDGFLAELRDEARARGLSFKLSKRPLTEDGGC